MKRVLLIVVCIFCLIRLHAQFRIDYHASYANYNMSDMKDFVHSVKSSEPFRQFGMELVEDFPAYIAHSVNIGYRLSRHEFGFKSGFYSTGSKLSVGDYSGKINISFTTNGYREGIYYKNYFYSLKSEDSQGVYRDRFSVWGEVSPALIISTLNIKTTLTDVDMQEVVDVDDPEYNENAGSLLLQAGGRYYINRMVNLDLSVGYDISFGGNYDGLNGSPRSDWSGLRLSGGLGFSF